MARCILIPEKIVRDGLKRCKQQCDEDWTCVWPQDSPDGVYLQDFTNGVKLTYPESFEIFQELLNDYGYDLTGVSVIYYTTSKFYIAVWNDAQEQ